MPTVRTALRLPATLVAAALLGLLPSAALAVPGTGEGTDGQTLTVSRATDLDPTGTTVTVTGAGFEETVGIYVGVCVDNGPGERPTPCLGGVDMGGEGGSSAWVSSNPPSYGKDLATPFGDGGSFGLELTVQGTDANVDCSDAAAAPRGCVLATFADHTRLTDRSADVRVPLTFVAAGAPAPTATEPSTTEPSTTEPSTTERGTTDASSPASTTATPTTPAAPAPSSTDDEGATTRFWLLTSAGLLVAAVATTYAVRRVRAVRAQEDAAATGATGADDASPTGSGA
ncbi:hypothetical protein IGS67_00030 [Flavimobilis sp. GY10621]|uniref:Neocarzinostatin family protein n=1 Tax=Flavimobilis rhizosphaerae TaxID=2775421 RepID=A0ABR9DL45_9MICO|nr:hypothetical protein [Flavimobilis rhizosphaerae]MBD9697890.1 hypothetical protein [Flavimobilis rhizosphaerae]